MTEDEEYDDLAGIDLGRLELDQVRVDEEDAPTPDWVQTALGVFLGALAATLAWAAQSDELAAAPTWVHFSLGLLAIAVGLGFGRWLWAVLERVAERANAAPDEPVEPLFSPETKRWLTLLGGLGGVGALAYGLATGAFAGEGAGQRGSWFAAASGAIVSGLLLSRWLMAQAEAAREASDADDEPPFVFPPWAKWVTLGILVVAGGTTAVVGYAQSDASSGDGSFLLGAVGFVIGVGAAIWLVRRFDEMERRSER